MTLPSRTTTSTLLALAAALPVLINPWLPLLTPAQAQALTAFAATCAAVGSMLAKSSGLRAAERVGERVDDVKEDVAEVTRTVDARGRPDVDRLLGEGRR